MFALIDTRYIQFPEQNILSKKFANASFFNDIVNYCFCDGHKVIHHLLITREIYGYIHNFCNKKVMEMTGRNGRVREVTDVNGQYFSCIFHNGFKFDMVFLTKGIFLSLWKTQDISLLGSSLTNNTGKHTEFIDLIKYYQQPLSKLAKSTEIVEKNASCHYSWII